MQFVTVVLNLNQWQGLHAPTLICFWKSFRKFIRIGKEVIPKLDQGSILNTTTRTLNSMAYKTLFSQRHIITELNHYLLHRSWDEEPEEMRGYLDSKTTAVCIRPLSCWWLVINWILLKRQLWAEWLLQTPAASKKVLRARFLPTCTVIYKTCHNTNLLSLTTDNFSRKSGHDKICERRQ